MKLKIEKYNNNQNNGNDNYSYDELTSNEQKVIKLIREKPHQKILIRVSDYKIVHITVEESLKI